MKCQRQLPFSATTETIGYEMQTNAATQTTAAEAFDLMFLVTPPGRKSATVRKNGGR
jgi:hypothetical protein